MFDKAMCREEGYALPTNGRAEKFRKGWYAARVTADQSRIISKEQLDEAREDTPAALFDQEYMCARVTDEEMVLISSKSLDRLRGLTFVGVPEVMYASSDPALEGDECPTFAWRGRKIVDALYQRERDTMKIAANIVAFCNRHNIHHLAIDAGGLGKGVADRVMQIAGSSIRVAQYTGGSDGGPKYRNLRTKIWCTVANLVRDKELAYPEDAELRRQICAVHYMPADYADQLRLEPKKITKKRLGCSPDRGDAWVLGAYLGSRLAAQVNDWDEDEDEDEVAMSYGVRSAFV